jgi:hypothetical protein
MAVWEDGKLIHASVVVRKGDELAGPKECALVARLVREVFMSKPWVPLLCPPKACAPNVLVLEVPQIYQRAAGKSKGDPSKILPVYGVACALAAMFHQDLEVHYGTPREWKGGVGKPKSVKETYAITERVLARLSEEEKKHIEWAKNGAHNYDIADALGIGLFFLNRFERHRALSRE